MHKAIELWHNNKLSWFSEVNLNFSIEENILVKSIYSLISIGTEQLVVSEQLPKELSNKMKVPYMKGDFNKKFTYGYSLVGKVVKGPTYFINKTVHLMHPHQNKVVANPEDLTIVPDNLDPKLATLASNMETAINAIWDAQIEIGDKVLIIGYGTIGALVAIIARNIPGVEVFILEKDIYRTKAAKTHGFEILSRKNESKFDVVFNTSASEQMLQKAIDLVRIEGKIIELSWYGAKSVNIKLGDEFHHGRKQIICSQVSLIPLRKQPVWNHQKRKELVFKILSQLNPTFLIDLKVRFSDVSGFYADLRNKKIKCIGAVIKY